jgi:hypothetical protein
MYRWNRVGIPLWKYATSTARNATQQQELPSLTGFASRHLSIRTILKGSTSEVSFDTPPLRHNRGPVA